MNNRWAKLPASHQALIAEAVLVMHNMFPNKTEEEYHRAESVIATCVRSRKRGTKRIWTLVVSELNFDSQITEALS